MKISFFFKQKGVHKSPDEEEKRDLSAFAQQQFRELAKKNLNIPVKLYQL